MASRTDQNFVILTTSNDWERWISQLRSKTGDDFWSKYCNPTIDTPTRPPSLPEAPIRGTFCEQYHTDLQSYQNYLSNGAQELPAFTTRSQSRSQTDSSNTITSLPDPNDTRYRTLSPTESEIYRIEVQLYFDRKRDIQEEQKKYDEICNFVNTTLASRNKIHVDVNLSLRERIQNLKRSLGMSDTLLLQFAKNRYDQAIKPPLSTSKTALNNWLTEWESAMAEGEKYGLPDVKIREYWIASFVKAIKGTIPNLAPILATSPDSVPRSDGTLAGTLTYRDVYHAVQREWMLTQPSRHDLPQQGLKRAALAAARESGGDDPSSASQDVSEGTGGERCSNDFAAPQLKRSRTSPRRKACEACGGLGHNLTECWHVIGSPANMPDWRPHWRRVENFKKNKMKPQIKHKIEEALSKH